MKALGWIRLGAAGATLAAAALAAVAAPAPVARKAGTPPAAGRPAGPVAAALQYNRDIRPILADNCFACHGPDSAARKAGLRIDRFDDATADRNGRRAFVPGKPEQSVAIQRMLGQGPLMPPKASHKVLTPAQIERVTAWVRQGAKYELHWSLIAPRRPAVPAVKNSRWVRNEVDRFILSRLEKAGLAPSPEADRRTLARRLSLDLTGLPPDPAAVEQFVNDRSPDYYEKYVDRLMASPQWGEHRGRYWLDAARYADTHGIHFDNYREMWTYRNWVIRALNENRPFDQFTIEQLAGDLLPNPTLEQRIATGFIRCNITTNEGGVIPEEYLVLYTRDRTETAAQVWMGTTANCGVCHDHKFDSLTQREFYELSAFFNNSTQGAMDGNRQDTPPIVFVPADDDRPRWEELSPQLDAIRKSLAQRKTDARPDFERWLSAARAEDIASRIPAQGLALHAPLSAGPGAALTARIGDRDLAVQGAEKDRRIAGHVAAQAYNRVEGSDAVVPEGGDFEKDQPFTLSAWVRLPRIQVFGAILGKMDEAGDHRGWDLWVENGKVGSHIIHKWPEDALKVVSRDRILKPNQWFHVAVAYDGTAKPGGVRIYVDGVLQPQEVQQDSLRNTIRTKVPLKLGRRHASAGIDGLGLQEVRLYSRALETREVEQLRSGTRGAWLVSRTGNRTDAEKNELYEWWLPGLDAPYRDLQAKLAAVEDEERAIRSRGTIAHVTQERDEAAMAFILFRGEYDKRRDPVKPDTPDVLPPMPADFPRNRLGLAKWLLMPEHPLTARVTVNRFWQEILGQGIVRTAGDFGVAGELPSHPELLDWLAVEFREKGWDIKRFFRLLVTSATYRQSAKLTPQKQAADPDNRLLSRGPRFRMDGEMIRDYALAASGLLVRKIGGPSVKPYQPEGVWEAVAMIGSNTRDYRRDTGENLYRRSMYTFWKRSAPPASMEIFNAPNRETCVVRRERTNTPLQALVTMNDVQHVEAHRHLAQRALKEGGVSDREKLDFIARRVLARPWRPDELPLLEALLADMLQHYGRDEPAAVKLITTGESKPDASLAPATLAAWTMVVNQVLNLDEALNK